MFDKPDETDSLSGEEEIKSLFERTTATGPPTATGPLMSQQTGVKLNAGHGPGRAESLFPVEPPEGYKSEEGKILGLESVSPAKEKANVQAEETANE